MAEAESKWWSFFKGVGGIVTDVDARVLDTAGHPINGLYAVGNNAASAMGESYPGAGVTLGPALTFGYIAGRHVMGTNSPAFAAEELPIAS